MFSRPKILTLTLTLTLALNHSKTTLLDQVLAVDWCLPLESSKLDGLLDTQARAAFDLYMSQLKFSLVLMQPACVTALPDVCGLLTIIELAHQSTLYYVLLQSQ